MRYKGTGNHSVDQLEKLVVHFMNLANQKQFEIQELELELRKIKKLKKK